MNGVRIVHLSDLHFGATWHEGYVDDKTRGMVEAPLRFDPFDRLRREVESSKPDFIVVSGDLAIAPPGGVDTAGRKAWRVNQLRCADAFLEQVAVFMARFHKMSLDEGRLRILVVPGNHDVDWDAPRNEVLDDFKTVIGHKYASPYTAAIPSGVGAHVVRQGPCFAFLQKNVLFCLWSTPDYGGTERPESGELRAYVEQAIAAGVDPDPGRRLLDNWTRWFREDPGIVGFPQREKMELGLAALEALPAVELSRFSKIAVLHHHLAHHPMVEVKGYEAVIDAASTKETLCKCHFDLVLHGHKHEPFACFETNSRARHWGIHILGAGCSRGNEKGEASFFEIDVDGRSYAVYEHNAQDTGLFHGHRPQPYWAFIAGRPPRRDVPVIVWPGYQQASSIRQEASRSGIRFLEHNGIGGNLCSLKLDLEEFDLIIDDHDNLLRMVKRDQLDLEGSMPDLLMKLRKDLIKPCLYDFVERAPLLPLRCGINAVSFYTDTPNLPSGTISFKSLLLRTKGETGLTLAAWDNPFVNIPILMAAAGPQNLRQAVLASVEDVIRLVKWIEKNQKKIRPFRVIRDINQLSEQHRNGGLPVVIGGGAWLAKSNPLIKTVVPEEGALFWVEAAGLISASEARPEPVEFLSELLDDTVQMEIANGPQFDACPIRPTAALWATGSYDVREIFQDDGFERLRPNLVPRQVPPEPGAWEDMWERIKELLQP